MKRFVLVLFALGAMAFAVGCKKEKKEGDEAAKPADTTATTPTPADQPAATPDQPAVPAAGAPAVGDQNTGIAECDAYIKRLMSCEKYPQQGKDALKQSLDAWKQAATAGGDAAKNAADACKKADEAASASLKQMGC